ncbi:hypothetical protein N657DRAFT_684128 [Parathielavia appendiculata]|uniref:Uncharacterized protein n=1 Tax=Parathielavia appendiculata TaxID=2587402 RepID=A0AAN6TTE3_9PEZI|nr:hypothetical protein N657DRAFT_684128 [Parathielavia appendiculata]
MARIPEGQVFERSRNAVLHSEENLKTVVADVLDWLARPDNSDWLLIFDNVDQDIDQGSETGAYDVRRYLPGDHESVLITTRLSRLALLAMDEASRELLGLLDGLPLALAQAASYVRETGLDTASYVRLYKQQWDDLMGLDGEWGSPLVDYEQGSVATTWTVSFKAVEAQTKNAANLLRLWALSTAETFGTACCRRLSMAESSGLDGCVTSQATRSGTWTRFDCFSGTR